MIRSLSESTKTSKHLSEMNIKIFKDANCNIYPLHQSMPEEVRQCQNVVNHLWIVIFEKSDTISCVNRNVSN